MSSRMKIELDSAQISAVEQIRRQQELTSVSAEHIREMVSENTPGMVSGSELDIQDRTRIELSKALSEWSRRGENILNGIEPAASRTDRKEFIRDFRGFIYGDYSREVKFKDSVKSDFEKALHSIDQAGKNPREYDIGGITVDEAVNRAGHYFADRYSHGFSHVQTGPVVLNNGKSRLVDSISLINNDSNQLETVKLSKNDTDLSEASLKLLSYQKFSNQEYDSFKIHYPIIKGENDLRWGQERTISLEKARDILDVNSEDDIEELLESAGDLLIDIWDSAATEIKDDYDLYYPQEVDPLSYFEMLAYSGIIEEGWENKLWKQIDEAISSHQQSIIRDKDDEGRRIYEWGDGKKAYSVTTILKPPRFDFGGKLREWKEENDGTGDSFDSEIVSDYASARGTLAHEAVLSNYVDSPESVKYGNEEELIEQIRDIERGEGLEDLRKWKNTERMEFYEDQTKDSGFIDNAWDLAEEELEWIEETFRELEDELGLSKENVITAEKMFGMETEHPGLPEIGLFSYAGQVDLLYEHEETGETVLLDLKTSKGLYDKNKLQSVAYAEAVERNPAFDIDSVDRIVIPVINPETMMDSRRDPEIYTDKRSDVLDYNWREFLDCSGIEEVNGNKYPRDQWGENSYRQEAFNLFARAASAMPEL